MSFSSEDNLIYFHRRLPLVILTVMLFFVGVAVRLFDLQVLKEKHYTELATEIFIREEEWRAARGQITDRNGVVVADTRSYYEIVIIPQYVRNTEKVVESLTKILPLDAADIKAKLYEARYEAKFMPVVMVKDAPYDWVAKLKEHMVSDYGDSFLYDLSGVDIRLSPLRRYKYPHLFAHSLGYLTEINKETLPIYKEKYPGVFSRGDLMGAAGIEKAYDLELKGQDGQIGRVVDARGRRVAQTPDVKVLQKRVTAEPLNGYLAVSTLDFDAQRVASEALGNKKGAVVALDPNNGEVLVLYSSPAYDANRITKNVDKKYWAKINLHPDKILFNRTIQAMYPPASTYKVVALTAGIDVGAIDPKTFRVRCHGGWRFGNRRFKCWKHSGHGRVDSVSALSQSCDVFFYQMGLKLGVDRLAEYARHFGLPLRTGIEIPFEKSGLIPTKEWKQRRYNQSWIESETLSVSIGQSYNLVTPLQNAVVAATIANGGYRVVPHLLQKIQDEQGNVIQEVMHEKIKTPLIGSKGLEWAKKGMVAVIHGWGTATRLRQSPYKIAGKTGTAQVVGHGSQVGDDVDTTPHALFIAFAPYDDPKIAVSVIVEHGRGGSATAAPVAHKVIDTYLKKVMP